MIIERQYVPFGVLFNKDKEAWSIFEKAFEESYPEEDRDRIMAMFLPQCLYQNDMGWCFHKLGDVIDGFERLDKEKPYDNGLSYQDVNDTEIVSCDEDGVVLRLICKFEGISHIVKIVEIKE